MIQYAIAKTRVNWIVWLAAVLGIFIFAVIYGVQVLVPTNVNWLLTGGDLSQHYIGWEFLRQSDWSFPLGIAKDLAYPHGIAITFMDSIPLLAIPFKLIAPILPEHFQYFGWWGLFSFAATAGISARIVQCWTKDAVIILTSALFFTISPVVLQRMFGHTALAGHWIILLAILAVVWGVKWSSRKRTVIWSIILALSVMIHPYFLVMNVFILAASLIVSFQKKWRQTTIEGAVPIASAVVATWLIGGFSITEVGSRALGTAGYDLISPINPIGWSAVYGANFTVHPETFGYYGLGGYLLIVTMLILATISRKKLLKVVKKYKYKTTALALVLVVVMLFAYSPKIRFAGTILLEYHLPAAIEKVWSVFRVTARIAWPLFYVIMLAGIYMLVRFVPHKNTSRYLIVAAVIIQLFDILGSSQLHKQHERIAHVGNAKYVSSLVDSRWSKLAEDHRHIIYLGGLYENDFTAIAQYSIGHDMTLNTGYFARKPTRQIELTIERAKQDLKDGKIESQSIYISRDSYDVAANLQKQSIDGYTVVVK